MFPIVPRDMMAEEIRTDRDNKAWYSPLRLL